MGRKIDWRRIHKERAEFDSKVRKEWPIENDVSEEQEDLDFYAELLEAFNGTFQRNRQDSP